MSRLEVSLDAKTRSVFKAIAVGRDMSEAALLRHMIVLVIGGDRASTQPRGRRSQRLHVRLAPQILDALQQRASEAGMTAAGVTVAALRALLLDRPTLLQAEYEALIKTRYELGRVGTNLNQIARLLHQHGTGPNVLSDELLHRVSRTVDQLREQVACLADSATSRWKPAGEQL